MNVARYARIYLACVRNCMARELEYRGAFMFKAAAATSWAVLTMVLTGVVFGNVRAVGEWDLDRMVVLTGTFLIVEYSSSALFQVNMSRLSELVNKGELDFVLIRPISSQYLVSTRYIDFTDVPGVVVAILYLWGGLARGGFEPSLVEFICYLGLLVCALIAVYSCWFMVVTCALWTGRLSNVAHAVQPFIDMGRVPNDVFRGLIHPLVTFVLPIALVATLPARALLGMLDPTMLVYQVALSLGLLWLSTWFWQTSLRRYSSASS